MSERVAFQDISQDKNDDGDTVKFLLLSYVSRTGKLKTYIIQKDFQFELAFMGRQSGVSFCIAFSYSFVCMIKLYVNSLEMIL